MFNQIFKKSEALSLNIVERREPWDANWINLGWQIHSSSQENACQLPVADGGPEAHSGSVGKCAVIN